MYNSSWTTTNSTKAEIIPLAAPRSFQQAVKFYLSTWYCRKEFVSNSISTRLMWPFIINFQMLCTKTSDACASSWTRYLINLRLKSKIKYTFPIRKTFQVTVKGKKKKKPKNHIQTGSSLWWTRWASTSQDTQRQRTKVLTTNRGNLMLLKRVWIKIHLHQVRKVLGQLCAATPMNQSVSDPFPCPHVMGDCQLQMLRN